MRSAVRVVALLFAGLFVLSAALQYNDPDPVRWAALYLAAAGLSAWSALAGPQAGAGPPPRLPLALAVVALLWALAIVLPARERIRPGALFATMGMADEGSEIGREGIGLTLVALWMAALAAMRWRWRPRVRPEEHEPADRR